MSVYKSFFFKISDTGDSSDSYQTDYSETSDESDWDYQQRERSRTSYSDC